MRNDLRGRTALVTGAAKRIGKEIAKILAANGVNLILHYNTSKKEAHTLAKNLSSKKIEVVTLKANLEFESECKYMIEKSFEIFPSLSILINNASIYAESMYSNLKYEDLERNIKINSWAPFVLSRSFAIKVKSGKIINLLDSRIDGYDRNHLGYFISKQTFLVMTKVCAIEFAPKITVNAVAPGLILPPLGKPRSFLNKFKNIPPLKRVGNTKDVTDTVLFLLKSDYITGQVIFVDGGRHLSL